MNEKVYALRYEFDAQAGAFKREDANGAGLTDAVVFISMIYPADGSLSVAFISKDGRTDEEIEDVELFKAWLMLSKRLAESTTLDEGRRTFCEMTFAGFLAALGASEPR